MFNPVYHNRVAYYRIYHCTITKCMKISEWNINRTVVITELVTHLEKHSRFKERNKIGDKLAVQGEGSISNNYMGDLDSSPRKFSQWGQIQLIVEQH